MKQSLINYWIRNKIVTDKRLITIFKKIPRENFVLEELKARSYYDYPLPIGQGQTISQPTTVIIMLQALELKKNNKVLEIGTGSGYNSALMATLVKPGIVYTTEIIPKLAEYAKNNLKKLKIKNVKVFAVDGSKGLKKFAPFDRIIVTAACREIPKPLIEQLKENGILLAPVGDSFSQKMIKLRKLKTGDIQQEELGDFVFVPLRGRYA